MTATVDSILKQLTLEEKAALCTGDTAWQTLTVDHAGLKPITVSDGPHGVRRPVDPRTLVSKSHPATCFPVAAALAATWNTDLLYELGEALADECIALDVDVLLGPGINMKRSPLCGRNFEYYSEDPLLAGELSASLIQGIQSKGVGTCVKHFAVNNQETRRFTIDAQVDERTLHEIYLTAFEIAIKKGEPWTVMCAYNRLNGDFCSQHPFLLTEILRDTWHYDGFVMSDWGAVHDRVASLKSGLELQMPGPVPHSVRAVIDAVKSGELDEAVLNRAVERLLKIILRARQTPKGHTTIDVEAHHALARRIAAESIVLLKNEGGLLPLKGTETLAIIGQSATSPVYQGGGSSHINSTRVDMPLELLREHAEIQYATGDGVETGTNMQLIDEAVRVAQAADVAVLFIALPARIESEGYDRPHMNLTDQQIALIQAVSAVQPRTIVILNNGSAVTMQPWLDSVPAVLEAWLPGQAGAGAVMDVLFGAVNPSGKLAETFPHSLSDTPPYLNFPGENGKVRYGEGLFIGYRGYDALKRDVLFPFGFGLSYTRFEYSNITVSGPTFTVNEPLQVMVDITNVGDRAGQEVVQLYVHDVASRLVRPPKELKAFAKIALEPGETKTLTFTLDERVFSYYDPAYGRWLAEAGEFEILIGSSAADIHQSEFVTMTAGTPLPVILDMESTVGDWLENAQSAALVKPLLASMFGGNGSDSPETEALGVDMLTFFRDLPLSTLLNFNAQSLESTPEAYIAGLLDQLKAAGSSA